MTPLYEELIECLFDGLYYVNTQREITFWNKKAEQITGFSKQEVLGKRCSDNILRHIDENGHEYCLEDCPLLEAIFNKQSTEKLLYLHHKKGHRIPIYVRASPL